MESASGVPPAVSEPKFIESLSILEDVGVGTNSRRRKEQFLNQAEARPYLRKRRKRPNFNANRSYVFEGIQKGSKRPLVQ